MPLPVVPSGSGPPDITAAPMDSVAVMYGPSVIRPSFVYDISAMPMDSGALMAGPTRIWSVDDPDPVVAFSPALSMDLVEPPLDDFGDFTIVHANVKGRTQLNWTDRLSDVGEATIELLQQISDGAGNLIPNTGVTDWTPIRYMLLRLYGRACMSVLRESSTDTRINQGEESTETLSVGQAPSSAMKLADTIIRPPGQLLQFPVQEEVRMDWTSPWVFSRHAAPGIFDYSAYSFLPYSSVSDTLLSDPTTFSHTPEKWPDRNSAWIWDRPGPGVFPTGHCYFYKEPGLPHAGKYQLWTACRGPYEVWLNGVKVAEDTKAYTGQATTTELYLDVAEFTENSSPGNFFAIKALCPSESAAGFLMALYELNADGTLGLYDYCASNSTFRVVSYPAQPAGMTAGNILLSLLAQSVDTNGQFQYWTTSFNGYVDSAGKPWPILRDMSFSVGSSILDALRSLADADLDWTVDPMRYRLNCYAKDSLGSVIDMELLSGYDDPDGNLRKLAYNWEA